MIIIFIYVIIIYVFVVYLQVITYHNVVSNYLCLYQYVHDDVLLLQHICFLWYVYSVKNVVRDRENYKAIVDVIP